MCGVDLGLFTLTTPIDLILQRMLTYVFRTSLLCVVCTLCLPIFAQAQGDFSARYSPDGKKILFYSYRHQDADYREAENAELYIMDADGSYPLRLTYTEHNAYSLMPIWSPDGQQIAFASGPNMRTLNAYAMNTDGSNRRVLGRGVPQAWSRGCHELC